MFVHQPAGRFDLTGKEGRFTPASPTSALPIDLFVVTARDPLNVMAEYARLTGHPEMPPLWALGYQQSHRTLASRAEVLSIAKTFRLKKLPCDALIYLGTGFCPSGWNTGHGSFLFNPAVFKEPKAILDELRGMHFHVVPHVVIRSKSVRGRVSDPPVPGHAVEEEASTYWNAHREVFALGVNGWWPDEGDPLEGGLTTVANPDVLGRPPGRSPEPAALCSAPQRLCGHAALRSLPLVGRRRFVVGDLEDPRAGRDQHGLDRHPLLGDRHRGLRAHQGSDRRALRPMVPVQCVLSALPLARPDLEAPAPLGLEYRRARTNEIRGYGYARNPGVEELHNAAVEPICRKYLNLRYQLMPYCIALSASAA